MISLRVPVEVNVVIHDLELQRLAQIREEKSRSQWAKKQLLSRGRHQCLGKDEVGESCNKTVSANKNFCLECWGKVEPK